MVATEMITVPRGVPNRDRRGAKVLLICEEFGRKGIFAPQKILGRAGVIDEKWANFSGNREVLETAREIGCGKVVPKMVAAEELSTVDDRRNSKLGEELRRAEAARRVLVHGDVGSIQLRPRNALTLPSPRSGFCTRVEVFDLLTSDPRFSEENGYLSTRYPRGATARKIESREDVTGNLLVFGESAARRWSEFVDKFAGHAEFIRQPTAGRSRQHLAATSLASRRQSPLNSRRFGKALCGHVAPAKVVGR